MYKTIGIFILIGSGILTASIALGMHLLSISLCGNEVLQETKSPNQKWKIVIFRRDCGAFTAYSTQISIIKLKAKIRNTAGNIFCADSNHGQTEDNYIGGGLKIIANWINNQEIAISYPDGTQIYLLQTNYKRISIHADKRQ